METNCIIIKNNIGSWNKLQNIQQRTTSHSRGSGKIETIIIRYHWKVQSMNRPQKSQVL